jgi:hypothetical protein
MSVAVPMLLSEVMSFPDFREVAQPLNGELILEILNLLVKDKVGFILWYSSFITFRHIEDFRASF